MLALNKVLLSFIVISLLSGCGSIMSRYEEGSTASYYSGVEYSLKQTEQPEAINAAYYLDVPFSLVLDTLLLPVDAFKRHSD